MSNLNLPIAEAALAPLGPSGDASIQSSIQAQAQAPAQASSAQEPSAAQAQWTPKLDAAGQVQPFDVYEAEIFRFALANAGGCVSRAAEMLGVGRATMYRKMRAYEIIAPPVSERAIDRSRRSIVSAQPANGSADSRAA